MGVRLRRARGLMRRDKGKIDPTRVSALSPVFSHPKKHLNSDWVRVGEKSSTPTRIARNTNIAAILLFRNVNMVSVTSFETFYDACDFKPKMLIACAVCLY